MDFQNRKVGFSVLISDHPPKYYFFHFAFDMIRPIVQNFCKFNSKSKRRNARKGHSLHWGNLMLKTNFYMRNNIISNKAFMNNTNYIRKRVYLSNWMTTCSDYFWFDLSIRKFVILIGIRLKSNVNWMTTCTYLMMQFSIFLVVMFFNLLEKGQTTNYLKWSIISNNWRWINFRIFCKNYFIWLKIKIE